MALPLTAAFPNCDPHGRVASGRDLLSGHRSPTLSVLSSGDNIDCRGRHPFIDLGRRNECGVEGDVDLSNPLHVAEASHAPNSEDECNSRWIYEVFEAV